jgi:hypothetical protein
MSDVGIAIGEAEPENKTKTERPPRLMTRRRMIEYIRDVHGIPITKSTIDKLAMLGCGPKVAAYYGKVQLSTREAVDEWVAAELCAATPKKLGA